MQSSMSQGSCDLPARATQLQGHYLNRIQILLESWPAPTQSPALKSGSEQA